jgi:hypothetical protein
MTSSPLLYLINDDEPRQFARRLVRVVRDDVRVGDQRGLVVSIEPPIDNVVGGTLQTAILVPRHREDLVGAIRKSSLPKPASVFVVRFAGSPKDLPAEIPKEQVSIVFWGRLGDSPDLGP